MTVRSGRGTESPSVGEFHTPLCGAFPATTWVSEGDAPLADLVTKCAGSPWTFFGLRGWWLLRSLGVAP